MLANELWVCRQFNLEIFCSIVFADSNETMILKPVERMLKILKLVKKSLNVQNKFISDNLHAVTTHKDTYGMQ